MSYPVEVFPMKMDPGLHILWDALHDYFQNAGRIQVKSIGVHVSGRKDTPADSLLDINSGGIAQLIVWFVQILTLTQYTPSSQ